MATLSRAWNVPEKHVQSNVIERNSKGKAEKRCEPEETQNRESVMK